MRQTGMFPGQFLPERDLLDKLSPIMPGLCSMIRQPFEDLRERRANDPAFRIMDEGETAQWLRPQIIQKARVLFQDSGKGTVLKKRSQVYLRYGDDFAIVPKKLKPKEKSDRLTFSSYDTLQNVNYWNQQAVDGLPNLPRLIVGYVFLKEMTEIKIWIAYPRGKSAGIYILAPEADGGILGIYDPGPAGPSPDEEEDRGFRIKPKRTDIDRADGA
ncbi:MAG: hypothetical protein U0800_07890 [Isosphaeraceae bacterium]